MHLLILGLSFLTISYPFFALTQPSEAASPPPKKDCYLMGTTFKDGQVTTKEGQKFKCQDGQWIPQ